MKTRSKKFLSAALSILLVLSAFAGFSFSKNRAFAVDLDFSDSNPNLYYLSDSDPILTRDELSIQFPEYHIVSETCFGFMGYNMESMIQQGYFNELSPEDILILEIKRAFLDSFNNFDTWLERIMMDHGELSVILICCYDYNTVFPTGFAYELDGFYQCESEFMHFIDLMLADMVNKNTAVDNEQPMHIVLDSRFVPIAYNDSDHTWTLYELFERSAFLRAFFYACDKMFNITGTVSDVGENEFAWYMLRDPEESNYYEQIQAYLLDHDIQLYAHLGGNRFQKVLYRAGESVSVISISTLADLQDSSILNITDNMYQASFFVVGMIPMLTDFRDLIYSIYTQIEDEVPHFSIYGWILDPSVISANGEYPFTSDRSLAEFYEIWNMEQKDALRAFLNAHI